MEDGELDTTMNSASFLVNLTSSGRSRKIKWLGTFLEPMNITLIECYIIWYQKGRTTSNKMAREHRRRP
jgi:hypothetical protein